MTFDDAMAFVLAREGGFSNNPADRGRATNFGITQATYDAWRVRIGQRTQPVRIISRGEAREVYMALYWMPMHCPDLCPPLDLIMFDSAVQHGVAGATKLLQRALAITEDGIFGPQTLRAARNTVAELVMSERRAYYGQIIRNDPTQEKFRVGWYNRLTALDRAAGIDERRRA